MTSTSGYIDDAASRDLTQGPSGGDTGGQEQLSYGLSRVALIGNPNTGKTTLFNRLCGLRHKTSNFPGTTQEARIGILRHAKVPQGQAEPLPTEICDLPGIYSLELDMSEAEVCRRVLAGTMAIPGSAFNAVAAPNAICIVVDAANLPRNLLLVGEALRRRLPTVVALNMMDLARKRGLSINVQALEEALGCSVVMCSARSGEGFDALRAAIGAPKLPNHTPPGTREGLEVWADEVCTKVFAGGEQGGAQGDGGNGAALTDRIDRITTHPVYGVVVFVGVMLALFWLLFSAAQIPMNFLDAIFAGQGEWVASWQPHWLQVAIGEGLTGLVRHVLPAGLIADFVADGVVSGIGATVVFLPQICLLFFFISLLEDTGYLARAAFVMDRALRPFGLPGHSFMPLLSSHACALPGIMACRAIPDRKERLATILVAPFMTCSARLPVYVLMTSILFPGKPLQASLAFVGCYALGIIAGVLSALLARRTILQGEQRGMALELPTYKLPSIQTAFIATVDRAKMFLKKAGTVILAICILLWWMGTFPMVGSESTRVAEIRAQAQVSSSPEAREELIAKADQIAVIEGKSQTFIGRLGRAAEPVFAPLGFDWQLSIGVLTSFAAREVFVSTMSVIVTGKDDTEGEGVLREIAQAKRTDGTPVFTTATAWSVLVFYVLAIQCLPTLAVTAREAGHWKWAALQFGWMTAVAYVSALVVYSIMS